MIIQPIFICNQLDVMYLLGYTEVRCSHSLEQTHFDKWFSRLRDARGKARILARLRSAELGNLGDIKAVGSGISEMRIHHGPGYRVYFTMRGDQLIILLIGGDKSSQTSDIQKAKALADEIRGKK